MLYCEDISRAPIASVRGGWDAKVLLTGRKEMKKKFWHRHPDISPDLLEYALLVALIALVAIGAITTAGGAPLEALKKLFE